MADTSQERMKISNELLDSMLKGVKNQEDLWGKDGLITQLNKALLERMLNAEMDYHLEDVQNGRAVGNRRDRQSTFEPQIIPKRVTRLENFDNAILSLYARGMTVRDIQQTLLDLYNVEVSAGFISKVTDAVKEEVEQWRDRPLEAIYPIVWLDAIVVKVHEDHQIKKKTIYLALGVNLEGYKELLGIWLAESEGAKFWAKVLTELNNRGVKDVFVFCVDGLTGFPEAIEGIFPKSDIQLCIVHMVRNSMKYVSWKDRKAVARDLKEIYRAGTLEGGEVALLKFSEKWSSKYPAIFDLWSRNWENLITIYSYPEQIRRVIYTTNAIESLNSVIKKRVKTHKIFNGDESALKVVWLAVAEASKKWAMPVSEWKKALNHFYVKFAERFKNAA